MNYYSIFKPFEKIFNRVESGKKDVNSKKNPKKRFFFRDSCGERYRLTLMPIINDSNNKMYLEDSLVLERILENNFVEEIGILCLLINGSDSYSIRDYKIEDIIKKLSNGCSLYCLRKEGKEKEIFGPFTIDSMWS